MFSLKLLKFHISFICKLRYHIYMITFLCSFNSSPPGSHPLPKIANTTVLHNLADPQSAPKPGNIYELGTSLQQQFFRKLKNILPWWVNLYLKKLFSKSISYLHPPKSC